MTDTNKLKELAELASKATPGPWWIDSHGHHMISESQDHRTVFLTNDRMGPATRHPETGNLSHWPNDWDASYIASADPTTILELIAEVERLQCRLEVSEDTRQVLRGCLASAESDIDRLKAENAALRQFAAEAYQVLGALDAPENVLDNASDAAGGAPLRHKTLLPFFAEGYEALRKDAERYRWLRSPQASYAVGMVFECGGSLLDERIDAALEGGGR